MSDTNDPTGTAEIQAVIDTLMTTLLTGFSDSDTRKEAYTRDRDALVSLIRNRALEEAANQCSGMEGDDCAERIRSLITEAR